MVELFSDARQEVSLRDAEESGSQCRSCVSILDYLQEFVTANVSKLRSCRIVSFGNLQGW